MTDNETRILAQIEDSTFQVLQNDYWITPLFESVSMDKVKKKWFLCLKVEHTRASDSISLVEVLKECL